MADAQHVTTERLHCPVCDYWTEGKPLNARQNMRGHLRGQHPEVATAILPDLRKGSRGPWTLKKPARGE